MEKCTYCGRDRDYPCRNTRDMTDFAIEGDDACYQEITLKGGGESGMRYIDLNRERRKQEIALFRSASGNRG